MRFKIIVIDRQGRLVIPRAAIENRPVLGHVALDPADVELSIESGPPTSRVTATRVLSGGALLGPAGMLLGGLARKNTTASALVVESTGVRLRLEFPAKEWRAAARFVEAVAELTAAS